MIMDMLHIGITVSDIDASVNWYTKVLGLELVHRQRGDNKYTRRLVGVEDAVLEVAQFKIPGRTSGLSTHMLELIEYVAGAAPDHPRLPVNQVGTSHLALIVDDIHQRYEAMRESGADFVNPPVGVTEGANEGGYACYLRDPDGNVLELMQFSPARMARSGI